MTVHFIAKVPLVEYVKHLVLSSPSFVSILLTGIVLTAAGAPSVSDGQEDSVMVFALPVNQCFRR